MSRKPKKKLEGIEYEEFIHQVKQNRIEPLYLFAGEEVYLQQRCLAFLFNTVDETLRMFNVSVFPIGSSAGGGGAVTAADAIDNANQLPMMASRRIVVIRDFEKIKENELDTVLEYLKRPSPTATVVFQAEGLDQRRKITTALTKSCTTVLFDIFSEQQAARWAEKYLKRRSSTIEPGALGHLIGQVGTRLSRLANELDKLATYAGDGPITIEAVNLLTPRAREHSNFELWDAIMSRDRKRALRLTHRLLDDGTEPLALVGVLAGLYRRMLLAKDLIDRQAPPAEVMKATGQYGARASAFNQRVLRTPREEITHAIRRLAMVDNAIKNSEATPRLQIEYLMAELTLPESAHWGIFQ